MAKMGKSGMDMCKGLTTKSPKGVDGSMKIPKSNTVNEGTRDNTAKTPATIGGRVA